MASDQHSQKNGGTDAARTGRFSAASNVVNQFDDELAGITIAINSRQAFWFGDSKTHPWQVGQIYRTFTQSNGLSCYIQLKAPEVKLGESAPGAAILTFGYPAAYMAPTGSTGPGTQPTKNPSIDSSVDYPKACSANVP